MVHKFGIAAVSAAVIALSPAAFAQQTRGTADEAKAMLIKAVAAVKADKAKALDMFNKGEGGFLDRDLYRVLRKRSATARSLQLAIPMPSKRLARTYGPSGLYGQGVWRGNLRGDAEAGRSNHRGQLYVPRPGADNTPGCEGEPRN